MGLAHLGDGERTLVMGVVNVTPDSFSDGGRWFEPRQAVAHGLELAEQGADLLDVGGESTRPGATRPLVAEELARVVPVITELAACTRISPTPVSSWRHTGICRSHGSRYRRMERKA